MKIDWVRKLTSRKFWIAVVGLVTGIILACGGDAGLVDTVSGVILAGASVIAYIIGEGLTDQVAMEQNKQIDATDTDAIGFVIDEEGK